MKLKEWFQKLGVKKAKHSKKKGKLSSKLADNTKSKVSFIQDKFKNSLSKLKDYLENHWRIATGIQTTPQDKSAADKIVKYIYDQAADGPLLVLKLISAFVFIFILWACFFKISETVKAVGEVIPSKHVQRIGSLEGGIIREILVQEGEHVKKDQVLLRLDPTENESKQEEYERDYYRQLVTIERLHAHIHGNEFIPSDVIRKKFPEFAKQEEEAYRNEKARVEKEKTALTEEVNAKKHELKQAQERLKYGEKQLPILEEQYKITDTLFKKGLYSKLRNLDAERQKLDLEKEIASLKEQIPGLEAEIKQAEAKLAKIDSDFIAQCQRELKDHQTKFDEAESNKEVMEDRLKNRELRAPIDGIVKEISSKTVGGVIKPGDDVLTIVPVDDELVIEAKVSPGDIGFVHPGQPVSIKITTYDYTIFGRLHGEVEKVSPDATQDRQERSFFKVTIRSSHNYLEKDGKRLFMGVGMAAELDIEIGRHSVMTFILKPILRGFQSALTER